MARVLIVGGGCRGLALGRGLLDDGNAVRITTRSPERAREIARSGAEAVIADPDVVGTLMESLAGVTVACWMLGTASGEPERVRELHGGRLRMFVEKLADSPVRGLVYEAAGPLGADPYASGRAIVERAGATWALPVSVLDADPSDPSTWVSQARERIDALVGV